MCKKPSARPPKGPFLPIESAENPPSPVPFPAGFTFPFLRLPPEVRNLIYACLFKASVPLYPTVETHPDTDRQHNLYLYPRPSFPAALLRTNRQIHDEAAAVLWGRNQIVLQFPVDWNDAASQTAPPCPCRLGCQRKAPFFVRRATFVPVPKHRRRIHDLVVEVNLLRRPGMVVSPANQPGPVAATVMRQLDELAGMLGMEHSVRRFEVRFAAVMTRDNPNEAVVPFGRVRYISEVPNRRGTKCCGFSADKAFGKANLSQNDLERLCKQSVEADQQVLQPLAKLRGIPKVEVVGRVTDEWTAFLKACMEAKVGVAVDESVFKPQSVVMKVPILKEKKSSFKAKSATVRPKTKKVVPQARRYLPSEHVSGSHLEL